MGQLVLLLKLFIYSRKYYFFFLEKENTLTAYHISRAQEKALLSLLIW